MTARHELMTRQQDQQITETVKREHSRLLGFIRNRVADPSEAEDVLQEVLVELVEANQRLMPIEHVTAWLFAVARNRITDLFRKVRPVPFSDMRASGGEGHVDDEAERWQFEDLLPSEGDGPDGVYARQILMDALEAAVDELPPAQRDVFVAHEWEGRSFKDLAEETGVSVNTLLSRKHYAVRRLRQRLQRVRDDVIGV